MIRKAILLAGPVLFLVSGGFPVESPPRPPSQVLRPEPVLLKIKSRILDEERSMLVSLPEGYETGRSAYDVLFTLDAEAEERFDRDCTVVRNLSGTGAVPPLIVVGIRNPIGKRNRDMIPVAVAHRPDSGGSESFLRFIREELAPRIGKDYRTTGISILFGGSNAGLFAVYAMLKDPDLFSGCIAGSPMIGHCPEYMRILASEFAGCRPRGERTLAMIYGSEDSPRVTDFVPAYQDFLEANAPPEFCSLLFILEGEGHVPASTLERGLRAIFSREPHPVSGRSSMKEAAIIFPIRIPGLLSPGG